MNFKLLCVVRQLTALSISLGLRVYFRWVPSEVNVADEPSRVFDPAQLSECQGEKEESQESEINYLRNHLGSSVCSATPSCLWVASGTEW